MASGDTYTVEFKNLDTSPIVSRDFSLKGAAERTWIFVKSVGKEYIVQGVACCETIQGVTGGIAIRAYVRQIPGPGSPSPGPLQSVVVESWRQLSFVAVAVTPTPTPPP